MVVLTGDAEAAFTDRRLIVDRDLAHPCSGRSITAPRDHVGDRIGVPFEGRLDAPVGSVPHPAFHAPSRGGRRAGRPEEDPLNAPADDDGDPSRRSHDRQGTLEPPDDERRSETPRCPCTTHRRRS
jgi:hypothetical protein